MTKQAATRLKRRILNEYKSIIKKTKEEIKRFSVEAKNHLKIIDGFENYIMDGVLFVKDRDNLITSRICNVHRNKVASICAISSRVPKWTIIKGDSQLPTVSSSKDFIIGQTNSLVKSVIDINKDIKDKINAFIVDVPKFIENINIKMVLINSQIDNLETFLSIAKEEYRHVKKADGEHLEALILNV
jgi:hypothetical protein